MDNVLCAICRTNIATQLHHISEDPEIVIEICTTCHKTIHKHGTGIPGKHIKTRRVGRPKIEGLVTKIITISLHGEKINALNEIDRIADKFCTSRSELIGKAIIDYVDLHKND